MSKQVDLKQQGMTLIELTVVLLILTSLATIALRSTTGLVEQTRWEQTKKRHEEIKKAIIGDPKLVINDQPDISGFVADMGRLPHNIHELLVRDYCFTDYAQTASGSCTGTAPSFSASAWVQQTVPVPATSSILGYGWNGPYLIISKNHADKFAFSDGWMDSAGGASGATDQDYGWNYSITGATLDLQSYGKDHSATALTPVPSDPYIIDYPENASIIDSDDWLVDISAGIEVAINSSGIGSCDVTAIPESEAQVCMDAGWSWVPGGSYKCFDIGVPPIISAPHIDIVDSNCSPSAPTPNRAWQFQPNSACTDPIYKTKLLCEGASGTWTGCADSTPTNSKSFCKSHGAIWNDSPSVCLRINYRSIDATGATIPTSSWDSGGSQITTTSVRQTVVFDTFTHFSGAPPVATSPQPTSVSLPAGKAIFEVFHFDDNASPNVCSSVPYPANTCELPHSNAVAIAASKAACIGATPAGIWDSNNGFCYGLSDTSPNDCTTLGGADIYSAPTTPILAVIKSVIPHKAIPQINW